MLLRKDRLEYVKKHMPKPLLEDVEVWPATDGHRFEMPKQVPSPIQRSLTAIPSSPAPAPLAWRRSRGPVRPTQFAIMKEWELQEGDYRLNIVPGLMYQ